MKTITKLLTGSAIALSGAFAGLTAAHAQTVAVADPEAAVEKTTAFSAATTQIQTTYKAQLAQADAIRKEVEPLLAQLDTNKDGQLSQQELAAAQAAKNPALVTIQTKQQQIQTAEAPAARAQAYAVEQISAKLQQAVQTVITTKKVSVILRPQSVMFADQTADITDDITTELNKLVPTASITPPAGWQPGQKSAAGAAPAGAAPAAAAPSGKKPSGR
jgi:Skp family chaperone for outer membrane proteins